MSAEQLKAFGNPKGDASRSSQFVELNDESELEKVTGGTDGPSLLSERLVKFHCLNDALGKPEKSFSRTDTFVPDGSKSFFAFWSGLYNGVRVRVREHKHQY